MSSCCPHAHGHSLQTWSFVSKEFCGLPQNQQDATPHLHLNSVRRRRCSAHTPFSSTAPLVLSLTGTTSGAGKGQLGLAGPNGEGEGLPAGSSEGLGLAVSEGTGDGLAVPAGSGEVLGLAGFSGAGEGLRGSSGEGLGLAASKGTGEGLLSARSGEGIGLTGSRCVDEGLGRVLLTPTSGGEGLGLAVL